MKKLSFISIFLSLLFITALTLRLYQLSSIPVGLHGDEVSIGYNAFSLLKTAKDQDGNFLPLTIDQFGDFRPPGYHYLAIPFVALLDLNGFSVRLPAALFGAITIILVYFLLRDLFDNTRISLVGSLLLTFSPWHINISRATSEGVIAAFFLLLCTYGLLRILKHKKQIYIWAITSIISATLSFFFYHSARFFLPAFLIPFLIISFLVWKPSKKILITTGVTFLSIMMCLGIIFYSTKGTNRPLSVSIFNIPGGDRQLQQLIDEDGIQHPLITRFYHNKLYFYGRLFLSSYFQHFNGDFLFVNNGLPVRYKVLWAGNLYLIELPLLLLGFSTLLYTGVKQKKYHYLIPLVWLSLAAVPAGLTWEDIPNIQRSSLMIYGFSIVSAVGFYELINLSKKKSIRISLAGILLLFYTHNILLFLHQYFHHLKTNEPWHRSAASPALIKSLENFPKDQQIIMTTDGNNNLNQYLFYTKFDPQTFHDLGAPREKDGLVINNITYTFAKCPFVDNMMTNQTIYVNKADCKIPNTGELIETIYNPDFTPAYHILRSNIDIEEIKS